MKKLIFALSFSFLVMELTVFNSHKANAAAATNEATTAARVYNSQGNYALSQDEYSKAAREYDMAIKGYEKEKNLTGVVGATVNKSLALQKLGQYRQAKQNLLRLENKIGFEVKSNPKLLAQYYKSLGIANARLGEYEEADKNLNQAATKTQDNELLSAIAIDRGNIWVVEEPSKAIANYQEAIKLTTQSKIRATALVNAVEAHYTIGQTETAIDSIKEAEELLEPDDNVSWLNLLGKKIWLSNKVEADLITNKDIDKIEEIADSKNLEQKSTALGYLAKIAEDRQEFDAAIELGQQALDVALAINKPQLAYQWQHQIGRSLNKTGNLTSAIDYYTRSVENIKAVRRDLVAYSPNVQYSYREGIEPVYRELVGLLTENPTQQNLEQARQTIESLQVAELENYFRKACLTANPERIDNLDRQAAVIYPIVLKDKIATIVKLPNQPLIYHETEIEKSAALKVVSEFLGNLNLSGSNKLRRQYGEQIRNWLVTPHEAQLQKAGVKTLVFVLDSGLRGIPVAALNQDDTYLTQQYKLAITPGLELLTTKQKEPKVEAVVAGLSEASQGFSELPGVLKEVADINSAVDANVLLNKDFTIESLKKALGDTEDAPIVHLATHGQFSSDPKQTFLLAYNGLIDVNELREILMVRDETPKVVPIDWMILSACKTAAGDDNAALGLAGVAVRSGARSTLATVWSVNDASTTYFMNAIYEGIKNKQDKASITQQAQLKLINSEQFNHPYYWGAFVLVGEWDKTTESDILSKS